MTQLKTAVLSNNQDLLIYNKFYKDKGIDLKCYNEILAIKPKKRIYKQWLLNLYENKQLLFEDLYKAEEYLSFFDRPNVYCKFPLGRSYIFNLKSLPELFELIKPYKKELKSDLEFKNEIYSKCLIKEFTNFNLYIPKSHEDACKLSKGTEWCTGTEKSSTYYNQYNKQGNLLIFISNEDSKEKYQLHVESQQFMNSSDQRIVNKEFFSKNIDIYNYILSLRTEKNLLQIALILESKQLVQNYLNSNPKLVELLINCFGGLTEFKSEKIGYEQYLYYGKTRDEIKYVFDKKSIYLYIKYSIWSEIEGKFKLQYSDIQCVIWGSIGDATDLRVNNIITASEFRARLVMPPI